MKAMILAAGRGERLRPLTERLPKPMIPIGSEPLIVHQIRWLRRAGIRDVVINVHHLAEQIVDGLGSGADLGVRIHYSREAHLLETGGGVKRALPLLRPGPFVVFNGDIWTNYPFKRLLDVNPERAHLVLTPTPRHLPHGDFHLRDGQAQRGEDADHTYCGIAVLAEALFADAPDGAFSLRDLFFAAAAEGLLGGESFTGTWIDIGTPEQLKRVRRLTL